MDSPQPPAPITLTAIPAGGAVPEPLALQPDAAGDYRFSLQCLPGADAIHLEIARAGQPCLRAEVRAQADEVVGCHLRLDDGGEPVLLVGSHQVLFLPLEPADTTPAPLPVPRAEAPWDLCLVIDATTRTAAAPPGRAPTDPGHPSATAGTDPDQRDTPTAPPGLDAFLLNQPDQWHAVVAPVVDLVRHLGGPGQGCRLAVIAFGDEPPPPGIYAPDLLPDFHLRTLPPERPEHLLIPMTPESLTELLLTRLTPSPGGDFVDALADALAAAGRLQWGDERRRLLLLIGDSPGHATAHPVPYGGDALPRRADVDTEAARLHRDHRVEVLTLYHPPPAAFAKTLLPTQAALIRHAREQYRRLAGRPALAFTTGDFDPRQAADTLLGRRTPLGRGACWGWLVEG
ncbi:hypothetical protein [uncultured Thiodictyon sp.]|jgi:hypothetical protein|uniref:hypothetical protein n=1 Tax=uncultured Thiodictyon sp. TaxID=1846217 RepID=UPI0025D1F3B3|nr:hypothetical protein [uncultured Thiodictyon sp.]